MDSEAADINGDYGEEDHDDIESQKEEPLPSLEGTEGDKAARLTTSQPAEHTVSKESQCSESRLGVRHHDDTFTEDDINLWVNIGKIAKRAKTAQMEIVSTFKDLEALLKD